VLLLGLVSPAWGPAAEVDSVTPRPIMLEYSTRALNAIFNARLAEGIANANPADDAIENLESGELCDEDRLYAELRRAVFQTSPFHWGLQGYALDLQLRELLSATSYSLSLNDSIYRDIDYLEGFSLRLKELTDVVRIEGHLIGLDKIGHFFAEGWEYFERTRDGQETLEDAMAWGRRQEAGKFGYRTTGIHSFADLAANFDGWRFWNDVLGAGDDPLKGALGNFLRRPLVACEYRILASLKHRRLVRAWRLQRRFDIADYVHGAWDEANNCNSYADPAIEAKVTERIREAAPGFRCPAEPAQCIRARRVYGRFAKHVLHPRCLGVAPE
jgi:hypothetical protein